MFYLSQKGPGEVTKSTAELNTEIKINHPHSNKNPQYCNKYSPKTNKVLLRKYHFKSLTASEKQWDF